jgi:hypothetical protein
VDVPLDLTIAVSRRDKDSEFGKVRRQRCAIAQELIQLLAFFRKLRAMDRYMQ